MYIDYRAMGGIDGPYPRIKAWLGDALKPFPGYMHFIGNLLFVLALLVTFEGTPVVMRTPALAVTELPGMILGAGEVRSYRVAVEAHARDGAPLRATTNITVRGLPKAAKQERLDLRLAIGAVGAQVAQLPGVRPVELHPVPGVLHPLQPRPGQCSVHFFPALERILPAVNDDHRRTDLLQPGPDVRVNGGQLLRRRRHLSREQNLFGLVEPGERAAAAQV